MTGSGASRMLALLDPRYDTLCACPCRYPSHGVTGAMAALLDNDCARHRRAVHGAVVVVCARRRELDRVRPAAGLDAATREAR